MDETTTTPAAPEVESGGYSEEQAMQALLGKWTKEEPEPAPEAQTPEESPPEQAQADAPAEQESAAEPEGQAQDDGEIEIDVGGAKFKAPKALTDTFKSVEAKVKEIEAGATRKFQEAAELRKTVETEQQSLAQLRQITEKNASLIGRHSLVVERLEQIASVDINSLDSDAIGRLNAEYIQLTRAKSKLEQDYQTNIQQTLAEQKKALKARQDHAQKIVASEIKDWGEEKQKQLAEYAVARGVPVEVLNNIDQAWMVRILDDAAYGRKMRETKSTIEKRVTPTQPTLRPGATTAQPRSAVKAQEAMNRLGKTHSVSDAAMALLARSNVRKK